MLRLTASFGAILTNSFFSASPDDYDPHSTPDRFWLSYILNKSQSYIYWREKILCGKEEIEWGNMTVQSLTSYLIMGGKIRQTMEEVKEENESVQALPLYTSAMTHSPEKFTLRAIYNQQYLLYMCDDILICYNHLSTLVVFTNREN